MSRARLCRARRKQRGLAVVELALILSITLLTFLIFGVLLFGRLFYEYNVIQYATRDAARYLASVPLVDSNTRRFDDYIEVAETLVRTTASAAGMRNADQIDLVVTCNGLRRGCSISGPLTTIEVWVSYRFDTAGFFGEYTYVWADEHGNVMLTAQTAAFYAN